MNWAGDWIQNNISELDTVLDLGCGIMQSTTDIVPTYPKTKLKCKRLVGVDVYKPYLELLKERGIETIEWDLTKVPYPFEDDSFDIIMLSDIFEHLPSIEAVNKLIVESKRIARKKLFVITPIKFFDNISTVVEPPYPYNNLGSNKYQQHHILLDKDYLIMHGFKVNVMGRHYYCMFEFGNGKLSIGVVYDSFIRLSGLHMLDRIYLKIRIKQVFYKMFSKLFYRGVDKREGRI